jgi:hypothetical protein
MVWGSFSAAGCGVLYFLPRNTTKNAERYEKVPAGPLHLLHGFPTHYPFPSGWGTVCRVSKRIKDFLADKPCEVIDLLGNSQD